MPFLAVSVVLLFSGTFNGLSLRFASGQNVRLIGGKSYLEGRVEVYHNSTWGTVCDDGFGTLDAQVFCFMLGYERNGARAITGAFYGDGSGPIWLDDLDCNGTESSIEECGRNRGIWGSHNCKHDEDVGIICMPKIRLAEGETEYEGRIEVKYSSTWRTVCDKSFGIPEAQVFCFMLGFERSGAQAYVNSHFGRGTGQVMLNNLKCSGNETSLNDCNDYNWELNNCSENAVAGIKCISKLGIRLSGGSTEYEGRVEVYHKSIWGTICYNNLSNSEAQVLCHMLGYPREGAIAFNNAHFGQGTGQIWLDYLDCDGQESSIVTCKNTSFEYNNCSHEHDVGIRCGPNVRLVGGDSEFEGRVEVFHSGQWGTVCDDSFTLQEAKVLCYMLGYQRNGSEVLPAEYFYPGNGTIWLDDLECTGIETSIDDCNKNEDTWGTHNCAHSEDAGVKCRPKSACPGLALPQNGRYSNSSCSLEPPVLQNCILLCDSGFNPSSYDSTACFGSGIWNVSDAFLTCTDINECSTGVHECAQICRNTPGTYECHCNNGYNLAMDNTTCYDIDECSTSNGGCEHNCTNVVGSFQCSCIDGYSIGNDNLSCDDLDECANDKGGCDHICVNEVGSFSCKCFNGYTLLQDGLTCEDVNECDVGNGGCEQMCNNTNGTFFCDCYAGYVISNETACENVDECAVENGGCDHLCQNVIGSFSCSCISGYELLSDNVTCEDVNECEDENGGCEQECKNENGTFSCDCFSGYLIDLNSSTCVDINECESNNGGCETICKNLNGTYACSCSEGFSLQNDTSSCEDDNECEIENGGCAHFCVNALGTYSCSCESGYSLMTDKLSCTDDNECNTNKGGCEQRCVNKGGSFACSCVDGFVLDKDGFTCEDIIECDKDNGKCQQLCLNLLGSFSCSCENSFILNENGFSCDNVSDHSMSSSLKVKIGELAVERLNEPVTYSNIRKELGKSLQWYFRNYTIQPISIVVRQLRLFTNSQRNIKNDTILVDYTIVFNDENIPLNIQNSTIRGILDLNDWTSLVYEDHHVLAILVNAPPSISPQKMLVSLSENTPVGTVIGEFIVNDPDYDVRGDIHVYSDDIPAEIDIGDIIKGKVQLKLQKQLDADKYKNSEKYGKHTPSTIGPIVNFTVVVKDKPGMQVRAYVSLTIIDVNDNGPSCQQKEVVVEIPRDTNIGADVFNVKTLCRDKDYIFNQMSIEMEDDSCSAFGINSTGSLTLTAGISDEFPFCMITVKLSDIVNPLLNTMLTIRIKFRECPAGVDYLNKAWKRGSPGKYTLGSCPEGYKGEARRFCNKDAVYLEPVYNCTSAVIAEIFEKILNENTSASDVLNDLANVTTPSKGNNNSLLIGDLDAVNKVMSKITEVIEVNPDNVQSVADSFIETANNILDENTTSTWTSMVNETGSGADAVLENLDRFAEKIANVSITTGDIKIAKSNLFMKVGAADNCNSSGIQFPDRQEGDVPVWAGERLDKVQIACGGKFSSQSYSSVMYRNLSQILPSKEVGNSTGEDKKLNAPVMSFSYFPKHDGKLDEPVEVTFQLYSTLLERPACSFWQKNKSSVGGWSSEGCWLERFDWKKNTVVCKCDHLTNFAVLMSPSSSSVKNGHHVALSIISMIGCILSMMCLLLTVVVHGYFWRAVKSDKSIINMNLACTLFIAYLLFLTGVDQTENKGGCAAIAVLLHIVYLAVFFIMLGEGLLLANTVLYPFSTRKPGIPLMIASYVLSVVIVAISMGSVQLVGYGDENSCWLSTKKGLIWAFLAPVLIIIVINLTIITLVIRAMFTTAALSKKSDKEKAMAGVRSIIILMPIMGLTWVLGIFSVNEDTVVFQYLFAICNSIQGVLIFVFHCVMNKKLQMAFKKQKTRWMSMRSYDVAKSFTSITKSTRVTDDSTSIM